MNSLTWVTKTNLRDVKASVSDGRQGTGKYRNWKFVDEAFSYSLRNSDFDIPTFNTILTMESILLDIKDLIYGRN